MKRSLFLATQPTRDSTFGFSSFLLDIAINLVNTVIDLLPIGIELVLCFLAEIIKLFLALLT